MATKSRHSATRTIEPKRKGQKKITYRPGGLHRSTGTPAGQPIPAAKRRAARAGRLGPTAQKQELMAENMFHRPIPGGSGRAKSGGRK